MEMPGVIIENAWLDVSDFTRDYSEDFFGSTGIEDLERWLQSNADQCPRFAKSSRLGAPVANPSKIVCIGLNYASHAKESGLDVPTEPILFFKSTSAICGPYDDVMIPRNSQKTDWEVELAIVIGKKATYVSKEDAFDHIAGYVLHNDISEREFQLERGGQWVKGKSCDTFAPLGPFVATRDEIKNPHDLNLWLKVNGVEFQSSSTSDLIFNIPYLIEDISSYMTLLPGDIISTGTPFGVGLGFKPPQYLKAGDVMELSVTGLGTSRQNVIAYRP
jgi:2,4-diketo-3-deoxy-L-fuconate hydrolase